MERKSPIENIFEHPLVLLRQQKVEECLAVCEEARTRLDKLKARAGSGDLEAASQLNLEESLLLGRIDEYTARACQIIASPVP